MTADLRALAERAAREAKDSRSCALDHGCGCGANYGISYDDDAFRYFVDVLERVARQAVEAEREACAQVCEAGEPREAFFMSIARKHIAADIAREALGEKERQP